jgi:RimJ/RimL family protein N-acetyltransferase
MPDQASLRPTLPPLPPFPSDGLTDGVIRVRLWEPERDGAARYRLMRDPDQDRWGVPVFVPRPVNEAASREQAEHDRIRALAGEPSSYAVVSVATDDLLGDIACRMDAPRMGIVDVGYGTLPEARGRGVASTALRLVSTWLLEPVSGAGLGRVQLDHATGNEASCRVALKAGFAREGVRRGYLPLLDPEAPAGWSRADVCLHGRIPGDETGD